MTDSPNTNKSNTNFKIGSAMERINKVTGLNTLSKFGAAQKLLENSRKYSIFGNFAQRAKEEQAEINKPIAKQNLEAEEKILQAIEANKEKYRDRKKLLNYRKCK